MDATLGVPKAGETRRTKLPDIFDGIRFEIGRLVKYVQDCGNETLVRMMADRISEECAIRANRHREAGPYSLLLLKTLHAWGQENYVHVPNPTNIDIIETPMRQIRRFLVPAEVLSAVLDPFTKSPVDLPKPKISGSLANGMTLLLTLASSMGFRPLRMRFGGSDGTVYYPWASVSLEGRWHDLDILQPFDRPRMFEHVENLEVPLP